MNFRNFSIILRKDDNNKNNRYDRRDWDTVSACPKYQYIIRTRIRNIM